MPRTARASRANWCYHVLNRGNGRAEVFHKDEDYAAFIRVLARTLEATPMRLCGFCLMPSPWHMVLSPRVDGELARFMQKLTITHVR